MALNFKIPIADNSKVNRLNFQDSIFILNLRIRMTRDTLRLDPPAELFLEKTLDDLAFINNVLETLARFFIENVSQYHNGGGTSIGSGASNGGGAAIGGEADYISDTEWQFNQLLTEFMMESGPFAGNVRPETVQKITKFRELSNSRRNAIESTRIPSEIAQSEPVVTSIELSRLLGDA